MGEIHTEWALIRSTGGRRPEAANKTLFLDLMLATRFPSAFNNYNYVFILHIVIGLSDNADKHFYRHNRQ
jgi:hypothetical protein